MTAVQLFVVIICGIIIGLAVYLLIRSLRKMAKGRCCEGCAGCRYAADCRSRDPSVNEQGERRPDQKE